MADAIQSFLALHDPSETQYIPPGGSRGERAICCCGNAACAYLKHSQSALDELERDVSTAARLGQALLLRHETYITDSEQERKNMAAQIETLEADKQVLERKNASVIEENRALLDQLEALNNAVAESDAHVTNLQATLASSQREMQKLTLLASRTENLERQLMEFEREQAMWQSTVEAKEHSERSAVRRWQTAERTLARLQESIEQIEREAQEERERHAEIVERIERRHSVEKELNSAAGRLKGAAALKNGDRNAADPGVVSHFVKDILQDNTNLQMGIVELREMLNTSNEEVENLRSQLLLHQPAKDPDESVLTPSTTTHRTKDLDTEMHRANSQELHVHHHYHAPSPAVSKPSTVKRPRKKRYSAFTASGYSTPPSASGASTPRSPSFSYNTPNSAATILQQTAASVPHSGSAAKRLSTQSNQTFYSAMSAFSGPSSPVSTNRTSSIFGRVFSDVDAEHESSRPTTPDTEDPGSPTMPASEMTPQRVKREFRGPESWGRTHSAPIVHRMISGAKAARPSLDAIVSIEELPKLELEVRDRETTVDGKTEDSVESACEEADAYVSGVDLNTLSPLSNESQDPLEQQLVDSPGEVEQPGEEDYRITLQQSQHQHSQQSQTFQSQRLRRANSHDSLLSVSGMDIHTLRSRPGQLLAPYAGRAGTSQAVLSGTNVHAARPAAMSRDSATGRSILTGMAAEQRQPAKQTVAMKFGGWMSGIWGSAPVPSATVAASAVAAASNTGVSTSSTKVNTKKPPAPAVISQEETKKDRVEHAGTKRPKSKSVGINQEASGKGFLPAGAKAVPATKAPILNNLDEEALRNILAEN